MKVRLKIEGLHCANCARKIEGAIRDLEGVEHVRLDFTSSTLTVRTSMVPDDLRRAVQRIADRIEPGTRFVIDGGSEGHMEVRRSVRPMRAAVCSVAFIITLALSLTGTIDELVSSVLFIGVFAIAGSTVLFYAIRGLMNGDIFNEKFLMSVATIGAILIGEFTEAAAVMTLYSIGELIEGYAVESSRNRVSRLFDMVPRVAHVKRDRGIVDVSPEDVSIGEHIMVRPGERVPLDGEILSGRTELDTSAITGESVPRVAGIGDEVLSGSVNTSATITLRTTRCFDDSAMMRIVSMIEDAGDRKAKSERFITRFARYYTPTVCCLALLIATIPILMGLDTREWVYRALTFLVLSCPCALVISIPMTIVSGIGCASSKGILIKGGGYLERLKNIDTIAFDKTGTLTKGRFVISDIVSDDPDGLVAIVCALESGSNHPLAKAIRDHFVDRTDVASDIEELPGRGLMGTVCGTTSYIGNATLMRDIGMPIEDSDEEIKVHVAFGDRYLGHISFKDELKDEAQRTMVELRSSGVGRIIMLTGDKEGVAKKVATHLDMDGFVAEMLPEDKIMALEDIISESKGAVAFVGDGINDGPSLKRADIGISMGQVGSDSALEASDVIIVGDDLSKIPLSMRISRRTISIVKQNIALSLGLKSAILLLTVLGLSEMWGAVVADMGACVLSILNSLRALRV